jgi:hypothetical protein
VRVFVALKCQFYTEQKLLTALKPSGDILHHTSFLSKNVPQFRRKLETFPWPNSLRHFTHSPKAHHVKNMAINLQYRANYEKDVITEYKHAQQMFFKN